VSASRATAPPPETQDGGLWRLYWIAVTIIAIGAFVLAITAPGPMGLSIGLATLLVGSVLLYAVVPPLVIWLIRQVPLRAVRLLLFVALPVSFLLAREGFLGKSMAFDCALVAHGPSETRESLTEDVQTSRSNLAGVPIACLAQGSASNVAKGFAEAAKNLGCVPAERATAQVTLVVEAADAFCYVPFYKEAQISFHARITLVPGPNEPASSVEVDGQVEHRDYGPESCRQFNREFGKAIAERMMVRYHELVAKQLVKSEESRKAASRLEQVAKKPKKAKRR
jgi:hypothetical protein